MGVLASFAEGFLGKSGVSLDSVAVRGGCDDSEEVVCVSRFGVCAEAVDSVSRGGGERVVEVMGGGREGVVGGDTLSKLDVCVTA